MVYHQKKLEPRSWRSPLIITGVAIALGVGSLMLLTNPSQKAYEEYGSEELTEYVKKNICTQAPKILGDLLQNQCKNWVDVGRPQIKKIISQTTEHHNFLFFSLYETDLSLGDSLPGYRFRTIGIFSNFYTYQSEQL